MLGPVLDVGSGGARENLAVVQSSMSELWWWLSAT